jgi:hypothetical protein
MKKLEERRDQYKKLFYEPFRAVLTLGSPVVLGSDPIYLDSLLTFQVAIEVLGADALNREQKDLLDIPLPLKRAGQEHPVWAGSRGYVQSPYRFHREFWTRRADNDHVTGSQKVMLPLEFDSKGIVMELKVEESTGGPNPDLSRGGFRSLYSTFKTVTTPGLVFYGMGNIDEVKRLLTEIGSVGAERNQGFGRVVKVEVQAIKPNYSFFDASGQPARVLPISDWAQEGRRWGFSYMNYCPPYWKSGDRVMSFVPRAGVMVDPNLTKPKRVTSTWEEDWGDEEEMDD